MYEDVCFYSLIYIIALNSINTLNNTLPVILQIENKPDIKLEKSYKYKSM